MIPFECNLYLQLFSIKLYMNIFFLIYFIFLDEHFIIPIKYFSKAAKVIDFFIINSILKFNNTQNYKNLQKKTQPKAKPSLKIL